MKRKYLEKLFELNFISYLIFFDLRNTLFVILVKSRKLWSYFKRISQKCSTFALGHIFFAKCFQQLMINVLYKDKSDVNPRDLSIENRIYI